MKNVTIDQESEKSIEITPNAELVEVSQDMNFIFIENENRKFFALSICPELSEEIERLKEQQFRAIIVIKKHKLEEEYHNLKITH